MIGRSILSTFSFLLFLLSTVQFPALAESTKERELNDKLAELRRQIPPTYTSMLKAANEYATVKAKEKEIEAAEQDRHGTRWDSLGLSGGIGSSSSTSNVTSVESQSSSISASLSISLNSWFIDNALELTEEIQRNALKALKIQLALETGASHFNYESALTQYIVIESLNLGLSKLKRCSKEGFITLSPASIALLDVQLTNNLFKLESIDAKFQVSRSNLKRLTALDYPDSVAAIKNTMAELRKHGQNEPCKESDSSIEAKWTTLDWVSIDKQFSIDPSVESAIATAKNSPALVMADLSTNMARNQWYLSLAGMAPVLTFAFDRSHSETSLGGSTTSTDTETFRVSLGFRITAGVPYHLRAKRLLEESARLNYQATMLQVRNSLENSYNNLRSTKANIQLLESSLVNSVFPALNSMAKIDDKNFKNVLDLIEAAFAQVNAIFDSISGYHLQRAGILAQTGTLLEELQKFAKEENRKP